jgi:hypothetical protein
MQMRRLEMTRCLRNFLLLAGIVCLGHGQAFACGFDGPIEHGDGSGVSGGSGVRVATSWNSERAQFPRKGYYFLDLGPNACGEKIELFVNGYSMGRYNVPNRGMVTVPVKLKGNTPVR